MTGRRYDTTDAARDARLAQQRAWRKADWLALRELRHRHELEYQTLFARAKAGEL